jgi:acetylornithine deacetylase/succinyl-diaminopimelate desuccinylase-like protein
MYLRSFSLFVISAGALSLAPAAFAQTKPIDWKEADTETFNYFTSLIKLDTSNPPGNETIVAKYLQNILEREGIPVKLVGANPQRLSLIATLKGNGSKKPIVIMGHTDVVGVQREHWTQDPFGAALIDGYIWGRGTIDDKDRVVGSLMTMLELKRSGVKLDRDVNFVAESGEEGGSPDGSLGIQYVIKNNWPDIDAEYCLTEGGKFNSVGGKVNYQKVEVTEKVGHGMKLVTQGTSGHGSMPREDNAIVHLSAAVAALGHWQPPMHLTDVTRTMLERLALASSPEDAARINALFDSSKTAEAQEYFRKNNIEMNSILRTSISPNIIQGGFRSNVIPSEATATLDIRAIPGEDMDEFKEMMTKVIDDPGVIIESTQTGAAANAPPPPASGIQTEMFKTLERVQQKYYPGTVTIPWMATGATDMRGLRAKGAQCYGIGAEVPAEDLVAHAMHSDNERIKESGLYTFVHYMHDVVSQMAVHPAR